MIIGTMPPLVLQTSPRLVVTEDAFQEELIVRFSHKYAKINEVNRNIYGTN
jgi:hypothetical protein